ncbi:MAG: diacylglycerol/lipid kinase family protein [Spirochaetaceae bacterium]
MREYLHFAECIARILRYSRVIPEEPLSVDLIINTRAGVLSHGTRFRRVCRVVRRFEAGLRDPVHSADSMTVHYHFTQYHGHARDIAGRILRSGLASGRHRVVVSLGGDGTHGEILGVLARSDPKVQSRTLAFRLPLGSGNDGADAPDLETALQMLLYGPTVGEVAYLRIRTARGRTLNAFNVASVGIDAFVTLVSLRLKHLLPRNVYRIAAAVSAAFYGLFLRPREMVCEIESRTDTPVPRAGRFLLLAAAASAPRTYGSGMHILPGPENVCLVHRMSAVKIMRLKKLMYRGEHVRRPEVETFEAAAITLRYRRRLPFQADGEPLTLDPADFPLRIYRAWTGVTVPHGGTLPRREQELAAAGGREGLSGQENS